MVRVKMACDEPVLFHQFEPIDHALIDGLSGAEIMGLLLDTAPEGRDDLPPLPESNGSADGQPGQLEMLGRGLLGVPRYPLRALRALPRALPNVDDVGPLGTIPGASTVGNLFVKGKYFTFGGGIGF